ncbi:MAG: glycosyltransferase, partial [Bacteroidia bacterium]
DINSSHTQKWINGLAGDGFEIGIFSLNKLNQNSSSISNSVSVFNQGNFYQRKIFSKALYLLVIPKLIYTLIKFKPDIIHAHYASSYGLLGALSFFKPLFVSAWGSDVMEFPAKNRFNKLILKFVFRRADKIFVTSTVLKQEVAKYTGKNCYIIPFGINLNQFYRWETHKREHFTFACVKHLEKIYNIDKVVEAFHLIVKKYPGAPLRLLIIGKGSEQAAIEQKVISLHLREQVELAGVVPHRMVPYYLNNCDVLVNISETESFGVSIAEALACKLPVIISDIPAFKDLVPNDDFGLIVKNNNPEDIMTCMEKYFLDQDLHSAHAVAGYKSVSEQFNWKDNLLQMENFYHEFLSLS